MTVASILSINDNVICWLVEFECMNSLPSAAEEDIPKWDRLLVNAHESYKILKNVIPKMKILWFTKLIAFLGNCCNISGKVTVTSIGAL